MSLTQNEWQYRHTGYCTWCGAAVTYVTRLDQWLHFDGTRTFDHVALRQLTIQEDPI